METIEPSSSGETVLYTERAISIATFFGGPLAAAYLIAHNFRSLGKEIYAKRTLIIGALVTVVIVPVLVSFPEYLPSHPNINLLHLLWFLPAYGVVKKFQEDDIKTHIQSGGTAGSGWRAAGVGLVSFLIYSGYALGFVFLTMPPPISEIPTFEHTPVRMDYSGCTIYYDSTAISRSDAKVAGAILEKVGYFTPTTNQLDALFYKQGTEYVIAFGVDEQILNDSDADKILKRALTDLRQAYGDRDYRFRLLAMDSTGITGEKFIHL